MTEPNAGIVLLDHFIPGRPASFATSAERAWKSDIESTLRALSPSPGPGFLELDFAVLPKPGYPGGADLDNLCDPVIATLVNRLGWFGGRRPNILAFRARKAPASETGCRIRISDGPPQRSWVVGDVLLDGHAPIPLPRNARDQNFARWVADTMVRPARPSGHLGVDLRFAGPINLGDIATGRLKNVIDCLYPAIGGKEGAPTDDRITVLEASRSNGSMAGTVRVRLVALAH